MSSVGVLFVCLGNICRSPLAEGVFRSIVKEHGQEKTIEVDSAGTSNWHVGSPPDRRMMQTARQNGVSLEGITGRQIGRSDLSRFDYIFVMDKSNLHDVLSLDPDGIHAHKVRLFREFDPDPEDYQVPDPYYGGEEGFNQVYQMVDRTSRVLFHRLAEDYRLSVEYGSKEGPDGS